MNELQTKLLDELYVYAEDIRSDWSYFDGRELFKFVTDWVNRFKESEKGEKMKVGNVRVVVGGNSAQRYSDKEKKE